MKGFDIVQRDTIATLLTSPREGMSWLLPPRGKACMSVSRAHACIVSRSGSVVQVKYTDQKVPSQDGAGKYAFDLRKRALRAVLLPIGYDGV